MADPHDHPPRDPRRFDPRRLDPRTDGDGEEFPAARAGGRTGGRRGGRPGGRPGGRLGWRVRGRPGPLLGGGTGGRPAVLSARRRTVRWAVLGLSAAVLATAAAGAVEYLRLDGSIRDMPLFGGLSGDAGTERPDAFGRTPLNVLVIGSDSRSAPADCRLGGDCGPGRNADTAMVLHLSADRSHAAVLSLPRDTVTDLPACRTPKGRVAAARRGPLNSTLQYGPGCTVAAVHSLTHLPVDHFVLADFSGVVRMSDAVGGVPVCVDRDVYDPYSHLRLAAGRHTVRGRAALAFLRSRHAFGDGGDLGRADAQHLFLSALALRMRGAGSFGHPEGLLSLAEAATGALTVDTGLASLTRLAALAADVRKVPPARLVFTTMPTLPDPRNRNRLVPGPGADRVFGLLASDLPLRVSGPPATPGAPGVARRGPAVATTGAGRPVAPVQGPRAQGPPADEAFEGDDAGTPPVAAALDKAAYGGTASAGGTAPGRGVRDASGRGAAGRRAAGWGAAGRGASVRDAAQDATVPGLTGADLVPVDPPGSRGPAADGPAPRFPASDLTAAVLTAAVLSAYEDGPAAPGGGSEGPPAVPGRTASATGCARVARQSTVAVSGVRMNPTAAFAATPKVPLSAP